MKNTSFAVQVEEAYAALRQLVMEHRDEVCNPEFADAITHERYTPPASITDPFTIHFIIIASHGDWESIYQLPIAGSDEMIGDFCGRLAETGMRQFPWTREEFNALRREIIYGDHHYSNYLADMDEFTKHYTATHSYRSLVHLFTLTSLFGHTDQAKEHLRQIRDFREEEPDANIDYLIFAAAYYKQHSITEHDLDEVRQIVEGFQRHDTTNRLVAQYDPVVYLRVWADLLFDFLYALQDTRLQQPEAQRSLKGAASNTLWRDHSALLQLDQEFVGSASNDEFELMKKHDELLLELVQYHPEGCYAPIFKGTDILLWYKRLNLSFPEKLDCLLMEGPPKAQCRHPNNITKEIMMNRLIAEFPANEATIRDTLLPQEDSVEDGNDAECDKVS